MLAMLVLFHMVKREDQPSVRDSCLKLASLIQAACLTSLSTPHPQTQTQKPEWGC